MPDQTSNRIGLTWPASWRPRQHVARRDASPVPLPWRETVRKRAVICLVFLGLWTGAIEARLFYLQVVRHRALVAQADNLHVHRVKLPGKRGEVRDRNGKPLALSVETITVGVDPTLIEDPPAAAAAICGALKGCDAKRRRRIAEDMARAKRQGSQFLHIVRRLPAEEAAPLRELGIKGLVTFPESKRYYPNGQLASHLLGFVDIDNNGLAGIEKAYNKRIRGGEGKVIFEADEHGRLVETRERKQPQAGEDIELTIDKYLQYVVEQELKVAVQDNRASSGRVVVMEPRTGQILALANYPTYDPNAPGAVSPHAKRNRSVEDMYEPGSTFKLVTASAALQEQVIEPDDPVDCSPGHIRFGKRLIEDTHVYGVLPFTDVIVKSSNVGAIKVGQRLGAERLTRYVTRFGFGQRLAPDFQGQNAGSVWNPAQLNPSALASVSMGYQVAVTPLQMAAAVSAVANGGELVQPRLVRAFIKDGQREVVPRKALGRVIEPDTAATLTDIMEQVVERGTATAAKIPGYTIAGKTGTASQVVDRAYSRSEYYSSFVGFLPSRNPAFAIVVVIDSPHGRNGYYGGRVAAPVFKRIAEKALQYAGVPPTINALPPVLVARAQPAGDVAPARVSSPVHQAVVVQPGIVPDVRGLSAREALRVLTRVGMSVGRMEGDGFVVEQHPVAGTQAVRGDTCSLKLDRRSPVITTGGAQQ